MAARADPPPPQIAPVSPKGRSKRPVKICFQCRNRKVRCDGRDEGCENCIRLGLPCSFSEQQYQEVRSDDHPAGKRKLEPGRARRACVKCHLQKAKCSGDLPVCQRCYQRGYACHYTPSRRQSSFSPQVQADPSHKPTNPTGATREGVTWKDRLLETSLLLRGKDSEPQRFVTEKHIEAYFKFIYPIPGWGFIHRSVFLQRWEKGTHNPVLLQAMCGASAKFLTSASDHLEQADAWVEQAEEHILKSLAQPTVTLIQALLLVIFANASSRKYAKVMALTAIAARMAFILRLHNEEKGVSPTTRECRNRVMWAIFVVDTFCASGQPELSICPVSHLNLHLPCDESCFVYDIRGDSEPLRRCVGGLPSSSLGLQSYCIRLFDIRHRIQCFARTLVDAASLAADLQTKIEAIQTELEAFKQDLPETYAYSQKNLFIWGHESQQTTYVMLHLWWHVCHCDLYRFTIPSFREALSREVLNTLPKSFANYCRERCWQHANAFTNILSSVMDLGKEVFVSDFSLAICSFYIARIISRLGQTAPLMLSNEEIKTKLGVCYSILGRQAEIYPTSAFMRASILEVMQDIEASTRSSSPQRFDPTQNLETATCQVSTQHSMLEGIQKLVACTEDDVGFTAESRAPSPPAPPPQSQESLMDREAAMQGRGQSFITDTDTTRDMFGDVNSYFPDSSWMIPSEHGHISEPWLWEPAAMVFNSIHDPLIRTDDWNIGTHGWELND